MPAGDFPAGAITRKGKTMGGLTEVQGDGVGQPYPLGSPGGDDGGDGLIYRVIRMMNLSDPDTNPGEALSALLEGTGVSFQDDFRRVRDAVTDAGCVLLLFVPAAKDDTRALMSLSAADLDRLTASLAEETVRRLTRQPEEEAQAVSEDLEAAPEGEILLITDPAHMPGLAELTGAKVETLRAAVEAEVAARAGGAGEPVR